MLSENLTSIRLVLMISIFTRIISYNNFTCEQEGFRSGHSSTTVPILRNCARSSGISFPGRLPPPTTRSNTTSSRQVVVVDYYFLLLLFLVASTSTIADTTTTLRSHN